MSTLLRLLGLARPFWRWILLATALGVFTVAAGVGLMMSGGWLISAAALMPPLFSLQVYIVGVRFFGVSRAASRYAERLVTHQVTFALLTELRVWLFYKLEPQSPARLMDHTSGALLSTVVGDIEALEAAFARALAPTLIFFPFFFAAVGLFSLWDWRIGLGLGGFLLLGGIGIPLAARRLTRPLGQRASALKAELDQRIIEGILGHAELRVFGREAAHRARTAAISDDLLGLNAQIAGVEATQAAAHTALSVAAALVALWVGIPKVLSGDWQGMSLAAVVLGVLAAFEVITPLPAALAQLDRTLASAGRIFALADVTPPVPLTGEQASPGAVEFRDLSFSYRPDAPVLQGLSLRLEPGKRVAILGDSGAGKSTIIQLLLRFWPYESGEIALGGRPLSALSPESVRRQYAVVCQRSVLLARSLRENLLLAKPDASEEALREALARAGLSEVLRRLGLDTPLGEGGSGLSGGERRRLVLARALLQDAPIWLLDEPLAHLDAHTASALHHSLLDATKGKTALWITHRALGLEDMDAVIVLREGKIAEQGAPAALLQQGGLYADFRKQHAATEVVERLHAPLDG